MLSLCFSIRELAQYVLLPEEDVRAEVARNYTDGIKRADRQTPRKNQMVNLLHFAMAVASVAALLIVSPRRARRKAIGALTEYADMESSRIYHHVEATAHTRDAERVDGSARIVDESSGD
jgi:hypothetical protein